MRRALLAGSVFVSVAILAQAALRNAANDEHAAIVVGQKACRGNQSEDKFFKITPREKWHARLYGDSWLVWFDKRRHGHAFMEVEVSRITGVPTDCVIWVE